MAKTEKEEKSALQEIKPGKVTAQNATDQALLNQEQLVEQLKELDESNSYEITAEYKKFVEGDKVKAMFVEALRIKSGLAEGRSDDDGMIEAVKFLSTDGKMYVSANSVLVSNLSNLPPLTPVSIECTGKEKSRQGVGDYFTFVIKKIVM